MRKLYNPKLKENARELRKNMTKEEAHLWYDFLRKLPVPVKRQKIVGRYILDFYCASARLAIEIDGLQHYDPEQAAKDLERDMFLESHGISVLRFTNRRIHKDFEGVCAEISEAIMASPLREKLSRSD